jgi:hypothetical protein
MSNKKKIIMLSSSSLKPMENNKEKNPGRKRKLTAAPFLYT